MPLEDDRRHALMEAARLARVKPGADYDQAAAASDAGAAHLLDYMFREGEFALGLVQAASYLLCGTRRHAIDVRREAEYLANRALAAAPRNPDVLRRVYTVFERLAEDGRPAADIILPEANWENIPARDLLDEGEKEEKC
jgi:hypothetical protein